MSVYDPQAWVYRAFDADGDLLYVGMTQRPRTRMQQHRRKADWWGDASRIRFSQYPTRNDALQAERSAIHSEKPVYNIRRPESWSEYVQAAMAAARERSAA